MTSEQPQGMVYVSTGDGDCAINVTEDPQGRVTITVNGESHTLAGRWAQSTEIDSGKRNDKITVSPEGAVRVRIQAGDGNDTIDDQVIGGSYIDTGAGDDTVTPRRRAQHRLARLGHP